MATIVQQTNGEKTIFKADEYTAVQQKFNDIYNTQLPSKANQTDMNSVNAQLADITNKVAIIEFYKSYVTGLGTSSEDWTPAINKAISDLGSDFGVIRFTSYSYNINTSINLPRNIYLSGMAGTEIKSSSQVYINVTGNYTQWRHLIKGIVFNLVGIKYGVSTSDYGNGAIIKDCELMGSDVAIEYIHNSWLTSIENCKIHNGIQGVKFSFATAGSNSGASMSISNSAIFNMSGAGIYADGITSDGFHIVISNTDIEHCQTSIQTNNAGDGVIDIVNGHWELNTDNYINLNGGNVFINGSWMFPCQTGYTALFIISNGYIRVNSGRINWDANKLAKITGGSLYINPDQVVTTPFYGLYGGNGTSPYDTSSTKGISLPSGYLTTNNLGSVIVPTAGTLTLDKLIGCDTNTYVLEAIIQVSAVSTLNKFTVFINPGGTIGQQITLPNTTGTLKLRWTFNSSQSVLAYSYSGGQEESYIITPTQALNTDKFIDIQNNGDSTMNLLDLQVRAL